MNKFMISCCSTADLSKAHFQQRGIHYICFHYSLDGVEYADDLGESISFKEFYKRLEAGADTRTSQVNTSEFTAYFTPFLEAGYDIIHVCLSSGLSGVINSAMLAKAQLEETYPDRKIYIIDSLGASSGYGLLMDQIADMRDQGMTPKEIVQWVEANKLHLHHWFFSTDLSFYIKGGRISKTSGAVGTMLGICPLLNMDTTGHLVPRYKIRTKKKVISAIVDQMEAHAKNGLQYSGKCFISHSDCYDDARKVADLIEAKFPALNGSVMINYVGTTIGSHTGPGTVAVFFWGDSR